ncbi:hypothetical protein Tco_1483605 [Tanacetum coccineum]
MRTKTELTLEQTQQCVSEEVLAETGSIHMLSKTPKLLSSIEDSHHGPSDVMHNPPQPLKSDTKVFTMTMEILPEPTSNKLCVMRTTSAAAKPCQGDSLEFYLITWSIYTDQRGTVTKMRDVSADKIRLIYYAEASLDARSDCQMLVEFIIQNKFFSITLEEFGLILGIPTEGQCSFSNKWSLDNLAFSVPSGDYGKKRGRHSTSASCSSAFDHPSSSHHVDDDNDENDEGTTRASTPSPTRFVNSLSNEIAQEFSNPMDDEQTIQTLFTRQTKILNRQVQMRDKHQSGLRSIGKGIKNLWKGKKKKLFVDLTQEDDDTHTPSPPNAPSKTPSPKEISSTFGTTSSSFESKPHSSSLSSRNTTSP